MERIFEVALVEDVALAGLDEEDDAGWVSERRGAVGVVGCFQGGGEPGCAVVFWEV